MRKHLDQLSPNRLDLSAKSSFELFGGGAQCEIALSANQIHYGFSLGQIHLAIQKSALRKFARPCRSRTCVKTGFKDPGGHEDSAMAGYFHQILARIAGWCTMNRHYDLIDQLVFFEDLAKTLSMRRKFRWFLFSAINAVRNSEGVFARNSNHGDSAFPGWRRDRRNGVTRGRPH